MVRTFTTLLSLALIFSLTAGPVFAAKDGFSKGATSAELRTKYQKGKIRILIAAGHEPGYGGAVYQGVYEREIVVEMAEELNRLLGNNPKYEIVVTRSNDAWNSGLKRHFDRNGRAIEKFVTAQKKATERLERRGKIKEKSDANQVQHAAAPSDVALRLYGINKWANDNKIDLVVNLHVNDAPDHGPDEPSRYTGFAVYVPDAIYGNHQTAKELGRDIADRLSALSDVSTLPGESAGVVESRDLIAVGAFGTLNVPSVLIEYGYITEPRFILPEHRRTVVKDTAYQTYLALQDFFGDEVTNPRSVAKLPTTWPEPEPLATSTPVIGTTTPAIPGTPTAPVATPSPVTPAEPAMACAAFTQTLLPAKDGDAPDPTGAVARLQTILAKDKTVYPEGLVTGFFGPATLRAVQAFQKKHDIVSSGTPETTGYGAVGPRTAKALLTLCSGT